MPNVSSVKSKTFGDVAAAATASLAALQTLGGAGDMTLKAAAGTGAYNGTNLAQLVDITCAADVASVTFSVTGTDVNGDIITEDITGVNANTVAGALYFATVTKVAADGAVGTNTSVGNQAGTGVGVVFAGRTRIRGMQGVVGTTAGNITFKNTSTTGTTLMDIPTGVTAGTLEPYIPDNGVLFNAGAYINAAANVQEGVTVFYDG